jgi:hypothetical protein
MVAEATQQAADMRLEHEERVAFQMRKTRESESEQIEVCTPAPDKNHSESLHGFVSLVCTCSFLFFVFGLRVSAGLALAVHATMRPIQGGVRTA